MKFNSLIFTLPVIVAACTVGAVLATYQEAAYRKQLWDQFIIEAEVAVLHDRLTDARRMYQDSLEQAKKLKRNDLMVKSLLGLGNASRLSGDYELAERCFKKSIKLSKRSVEEQDGELNNESRLSLADCRFGLACLLLAQGESTRAAPLYTNASALYRPLVKSSDPLDSDRARQGLARSLLGLQLTDQSRSQFKSEGSARDEAIIAASKPGLEWLRSQVESEDPNCLALPTTPRSGDGEVARFRYRAVQCLKQHDYEEAKEIFALAIDRARRSNDWKLEVLCMRDLATVQLLNLEVQNAISLFKDALAIAGRHKDWQSADALLTSLEHLADVQKDYVWLSELYLHHAFVNKNLYGPTDRRVGQCITHAAIASKLSGDNAKSEATYKQALEVFSLSKNADASSINLARGGLVVVSVRRGDYKEAEKQAEQELARIEKTCGKDDERLIDPLYDLSEFYLQDKQVAKAEALYKRSLNLIEWRGGHDQFKLLNQLGLSDCLRQRKVYDLAEATYKEIAPRLATVFGKRSKQLARAYDGLAGVYAGQGRWSEARILLEKRLAFGAARTESEQLSKIGALKQIVVVLNKAHKGVEAERYGKQLVAEKADLDYRRRNAFTYKVYSREMRQLKEEDGAIE